MALTLDREADAKALRTLRKEAGISQQRLAELARCSIATVRLYEGGYRPNPEMVAKLVAVLKDDEGAATTRRPVKESAEDGDGRDKD